MRHLLLVLVAAVLGGAGFGTEAANASTLRLTTNLSGAGTVTADWDSFSCTSGSGGGSCSHSFVNDAPWATTVGAWLTASAPTGWRFSSWSGCDRVENGKCWAESDCCYTATDQTVTASFVRQDFNLSLGFVGGGSATATFSPAAASCSANCVRSFPYETQVTITVTPNAGSKFSNWSAGCASVSGNQCTVAMTSAKTINAFVYPIPVNDNFASPRVITTPTYSETNTNRGATGETGEPNHAGVAGERESMWYRWTAPAGGKLKVTACGSHYIGVFAIYTGSSLTGLTPVASHPNAFGGGSPIACNADAFREIVVTRGTQYSIVFDGASSADGDFFLALEFTSQTLNVSRLGSGSGTVTSTPAGINCGSVCSEGFAPNSTVGLAAVPAAGSRFAGWTGACAGVGSCVVTMAGPRSVTATFVRTHSLTVAKAGSGAGSVTSADGRISCGATCATTYDQGAATTLTATPAPGSRFAGWTGAGCSGTGPCTVTMDTAKAVTATFVLTHLLTVTTAGSGAGSIASADTKIACGSTCAATYDHDEVVTLTASAAPGSRFAGWSGAGCAGTGTCVVTMDAAQAVTATFTETVRPNTRITAKPKKSTFARKATFRFVSTETPATFQCKLDKGGWKACKSPRTYKKLKVGKHTFRVRAKDSAGSVDASPAVYTWRIRRR